MKVAANSMSEISKLIILGAGRPFKGKKHAGLRGAGRGNRVLDWILRSVRSETQDIRFIGGYQINEVQALYPHFDYIENLDWKRTKAASSLLCTPLTTSGACYVSYVDILFHDSIISQMRESDGDVVVAVDRLWRERYEGRKPKDFKRCEKVNLAGVTVTRMGPDIDVQYADAEFIGLVKLSEQALAVLEDKRFDLMPRIAKWNLSELIEFLRVQGLTVNAIDVAGDWAELNESSDVAHFILGTKAETLNRLGAVVTKSRIEDQVSFTVSQWDDDDDAVILSVKKKFRSQQLVVRSSALSEDGFHSANAGAYDSVLNVDGTNVGYLRRAIEQVIKSYPDKNRANQVLVQPMLLDVVASGVVFTRTLDAGGPYYVMNYDDLTSSTESITSGSSRDHKTLIVHRNADIDCTAVPKNIQQLLPAVREIEDLLGYDALDIEFAISKSGQVHILQVRPIAVNHARDMIVDDQIDTAITDAADQFDRLQIASPFLGGDRAYFGIMPDWNPAEIIGTNPGKLATTLYRYLIMDETWARQRAEYGYRDVRPCPLLVSFSGRPFVDIRASFNSFIPASLDKPLGARLVNFYMGWLKDNPQLHDKVEFDVVPTSLGFDFDKWKDRLRSEGSFREDEIEQLHTGLLDITTRAFDRNPVDVASIEKLMSRFDVIMAKQVAPLDRALMLLEDCRAYGTLAFSHLARSAFVAVTLLRSAAAENIIPEKAVEAFLNSIRTVSHRFANDAYATQSGDMSFDDFLSVYGHLRPGTYDITSPRYADNPDLYLIPIIKQARPLDQDHNAGRNAWATNRDAFAAGLKDVGLPGDIEKIERFMRVAIEGREYAKFMFSRNLSAAIESLAEYGVSIGVEREVLAHVPLGAFFDLRAGRLDTASHSDWLRSMAEDNRRQLDIAKMVELPPVLFDKIDFSVFMYPNTQPNYVGSGSMTAPVIDMAQVKNNEQVNLTGKIVMIPQADPGYDWLFGQEISGLITMYGGANSHMAIRAAEFGLPAAIGIGEKRYAQLADAQILLLDSGNRQLQVVS